jgi:hypothetical protein
VVLIWGIRKELIKEEAFEGAFKAWLTMDRQNQEEFIVLVQEK